MKLPQGKYAIRVKVRWTDNEMHNFTISTLSSQDVDLKEISWTDPQSFLTQVFSSCGQATKERYQLKNNCEFISAWCGPYLWIYVVNNGKKRWSLDIVFDKVNNLKFPKKYAKHQNMIKLKILPGDTKIAYLKRTDSSEVELFWKLNHIWL